LGRKFNRDWIFRQLDFAFDENQTYAITGANGSGKSTLLQILSGMLPATEGTISYYHQQKQIDDDQVFRYLVLAAPYQELIEEFTLKELVSFHIQFKRFTRQFSVNSFIEKIGLEKARNKPVKYFSSGMKQRLKLGLAFYSDTPILLLDEPTSNLDKTGIAWYQQTVIENMANRLLIICSNQPYEYEFCRNILHIQNARVELN
jgi:ABC-type multidrug transport system ATPase subunit